LTEDAGYYDASDQAAVDNAAKEAVRRERQDDETIRIWLSHENGRDLIFRMLEECHIFGDCRGVDTHSTYWNLGERNIGNRLLARVQRPPALYMKMMQDQQAAQDLRNTRLRKENERKDQRDGTDAGTS
jgi:hypothetical protein